MGISPKDSSSLSIPFCYPFLPERIEGECVSWSVWCSVVGCVASGLSVVLVFNVQLLPRCFVAVFGFNEELVESA